MPPPELIQMPRVYVLNVPEFEGLIKSARTKPGCAIRSVGQSYLCIESDRPIKFLRREAGVGPAVWYGAFTGGIEGRLVDFGREEVTLVDD
jgi:hypothetical protein